MSQDAINEMMNSAQAHRMGCRMQGLEYKSLFLDTGDGSGYEIRPVTTSLGAIRWFVIREASNGNASLYSTERTLSGALSMIEKAL